MERRQLVGAAIVAIGVGAIGLQIVEFAGPAAVSPAVFFNTIPFVWIGAAIAYAGYRIGREDRYDGYAATVGLWAGGGAALFVAIVALSLVGLPIGGGRSIAILFADAASAGVLAGLLVGLYDVRSRRREAETEALAQQLEGTSHYGRALHEASTVQEISALCVQAVEFAIGGRGAAFVYGHGGDRGARDHDADDREAGGSEVLDSTLPTGWDPRSIVESAAGGRADDDRTAIDIETGIRVDPGETAPETPGDSVDDREPTREGYEARGADRVPAPAEGSAVVVSIPGPVTAAGLVVALEADRESIDDVERHLLELLGTHAAAALADLAAVEYDDPAIELPEPP